MKKQIEKLLHNLTKGKIFMTQQSKTKFPQGGGAFKLSLASVYSFLTRETTHKNGGENVIKNFGRLKSTLPYNCKFSRACAFTLAEVLITLAIIGIVAALTIPTVVRNYQKQQTVVKLKKVYNTINQAMNMSQVYNGNYNSWDYTLSQQEFVERYLSPYLKISKYYPNIKIDTLGARFKYMDGTLENGGYTHNIRVYATLYDGTLLGFSMHENRMVIYVDINGLKGQNIIGKEVFMFSIQKKYGLTAFGFGDCAICFNKLFGGMPTRTRLLGDGYSRECKKRPASPGAWCAALIMNDGWQIKDDYPW